MQSDVCEAITNNNSNDINRKYQALEGNTCLCHRAVAIRAFQKFEIVTRSEEQMTNFRHHHVTVPAGVARMPPDTHARNAANGKKEKRFIQRKGSCGHVDSLSFSFSPSYDRKEIHHNKHLRKVSSILAPSRGRK
jgi:hypothetical protein